MFTRIHFSPYEHVDSSFSVLCFRSQTQTSTKFTIQVLNTHQLTLMSKKGAKHCQGVGPTRIEGRGHTHTHTHTAPKHQNALAVSLWQRPDGFLRPHRGRVDVRKPAQTAQRPTSSPGQVSEFHEGAVSYETWRGRGDVQQIRVRPTLRNPPCIKSHYTH